MSRYIVTVEPEGCGLEGLVAVGLIFVALLSALVYVAQILISIAIPLVEIGLFSLPFLGSVLLGGWLVVEGWHVTSIWVKAGSVLFSVVAAGFLGLAVLLSFVGRFAVGQSYSWLVWIIVILGILAILLSAVLISVSYALSVAKKCSKCGVRNPFTYKFCGACRARI